MKCVECGQESSVEFYPGNKVRCKACIIRRQATPRYKERQAKYYRLWYARNGRKRANNYTDIILLWAKEHPKEVRVRSIIAYAIRRGKLSKPLLCSICGRGGRINAHHDDYDMPFEIRWVCSSCHKKIHLSICKSLIGSQKS